MDVPPPIPRARTSAFLLVSLFFTIVAVAITAALCTNEDWVPLPWERLGLAVLGNFAASLALIFAAIVLFDRRKGWPVTLFIVVVSLGVFWFLVPQLHQPVTDIVGQLGRSMAPGVREATQPLPQPKGGVAAATLQPQIEAWTEEWLVKPYEAHGHHDPAWDDAARELIRGTGLTLGIAGLGMPENLRDAGAAIESKGCDDPWVLFLIHRLGDDDPDFADTMLQAVDALSAKDYPPFALWLARAEAVRALRADGQEPPPKLWSDCLDSLRAALSAKTFEERDYRAWVHLFFSEPARDLLKHHGTEVCAVLDSVPTLPEWFRLTVRGRMEIDLAWEARGSGWANTVSQDQWQRFGEHLEAARTALERACTLNPQAPEPFGYLITVELGTSTGLDKMRRQFDNAVRAQFDYIAAYDAFSKGLLPRWFGSEEAVLAFGRNCAATKRYDTPLPWLLLKAVDDVAEAQDDADAYYAKAAAWKEMQALLDGYISQGEASRRHGFLSTKLILAGKRGADSEVAQLLKQIDYRIDPQAKADWNLAVQYVGRMAALSERSADLVLASERISRSNPGAALGKLVAAQKLDGLSPAAQEYIANEIAALHASIALDKAPWQPLSSPPDLSGWNPVGGPWQVASKTQWELTTEAPLSLITRPEPVGATWELRGEMELHAQHGERVEACLFCGPPGDRGDHSFSLRFFVRPDNSAGISLARGRATSAVTKYMHAQETIPFTITFTAQRLRVRVEKDQWFAEQPLPAGLTIDKDAVLSVGSAGPSGQTVIFRDLQVRVANPAEGSAQ